MTHIMKIDEMLSLREVRLPLSNISKKMLAYSKKPKNKKTQTYAEYIWYMYGAIQHCIENNEYDVEYLGDAVNIYGKIDVGEWNIQFLLNPNDNYRPDIDSENAVCYCNDEEVWLTYIHNKYSEDAYYEMEQLYGFEFKDMINLFGGGGKFPQKVIDAIDAAQV